jgi:hypothetical protein
MKIPPSGIEPEYGYNPLIFSNLGVSASLMASLPLVTLPVLLPVSGLRKLKIWTLIPVIKP